MLIGLEKLATEAAKARELASLCRAMAILTNGKIRRPEKVTSRRGRDVDWEQILTPPATKPSHGGKAMVGAR